MNLSAAMADGSPLFRTLIAAAAGQTCDKQLKHKRDRWVRGA